MPALGQIGKYELLHSLAVGGMAEVFLARQTGMQGFEKVVVIKRILPHLANQARFVQMFLDEARLAARFNHPNIVQIYDLGQDADAYFIAMEYIHGEDIRSVVKRCAREHQRIPIEHVVKIISGILDGLHYAHNQTDLEGRPRTIVHRDVSPHNIIVSFEGGVKLVDFGIAKARSEITTTLPGRVKGKHAYMSPEQCQGQEIDGRSDIFSAGIVLYELLTWTRLFKRPNDLDTLRAVMACEVRPPRQVRPEIDPELEAIVMKALARKAGERYQTAREMQLALEDFLLAKGLKSNSALLSQYLSDLFADKLEARNKALQQVKAKSLEGAVLQQQQQQGPDLVAFLDMFFEPGSGSSPEGKRQTTTGPEFTPSGDYTPAAEVAAPPHREPAARLQARASTPAPAPPPRPPVEVTAPRKPAPAPASAAPAAPPPPARPEAASPPQRSASISSLFKQPGAAAPAPETAPAQEVVAEQLQQEAEPSPELQEELMLGSKQKGRGFGWLVFLVVLLLAGGMAWLFHGRGSGPAAPATGRVIVKSIPGGADVIFDGSRLPDLTPTEVGRVQPGVEHNLEVKLPGLPPWQKKITLTDTTKPLVVEAVLSKEAARRARLSGKPIIAGMPGQGLGTVKVGSQPAGARVYLDGVDSGRRTPTTLRRVPAGCDHVVMVVKDGYQPALSRFQLATGGQQQVNLPLEKGSAELPGRLLVHVESEPEGAKVIVNGFPLKKTTPVAVKLLAGGASELYLEKEGYRPWRAQVRPLPGVDLTFFARLKKK